MEMEDWEDVLMATASKRVAHFHGQHISRVHDIGMGQDGERQLIVCKECLLRRVMAEQSLEAEEGPIRMEHEPMVELVRRMTLIDNRLNITYTLLTGECDDCGEVYFVRFPHPKEWR